MRRAASAAQLARGLPFHLVGRLRLAESAVAGGARKGGAACRGDEDQTEEYRLHVATASSPGIANIVGAQRTRRRLRGRADVRTRSCRPSFVRARAPALSRVPVYGRNRCKNAPQDTLILNKLRQFILGQHPGARRRRFLLQIKLRVSPAHAPGRIVQCGNASDTAPPVAGGSQLREHSPKAHLATRAWRRKPSGAPA